MSTATVYALCARGELPHIRILGIIRIAQADLDVFVAQTAAVSNVATLA